MEACKKAFKGKHRYIFLFLRNKLIGHGRWDLFHDLFLFWKQSSDIVLTMSIFDNIM